MNNTEFSEIMARVTGAWARQEFAIAFDAIQVILSEGSDDMKAQSLLLSGMIRDDGGNSVDARRDWQEALQFADKGSFILCKLQHQIGTSYARDGLIDEAVTWFEKALSTCANGQEFSCEPTLSAYLRVRRGQIPTEWEGPVAAAIQKSWRTLELNGYPPLDDFSNAINELREGFLSVERGQV